ncbi:MAG: DUF1294 domain-containing protein [Arcobacteraceae bacterium]|nr:DUF1294 domain-containing protein [Arcobacteraceae bacterium]
MININFTLTYFELHLLFVNISTFLIYGFDKIQAIRTAKKLSRVSEFNLLLLALLGGSIGSLVAMILFRHKIKKLSFIVKFIVVILIQVMGYYLFPN